MNIIVDMLASDSPKYCLVEITGLLGGVTLYSTRFLKNPVLEKYAIPTTAVIIRIMARRPIMKTPKLIEPPKLLTNATLRDKELLTR